MEEGKNDLTLFTRELSSALLSISAEELKKLEDGRHTLEIRVTRKKGNSDRKAVQPTVDYMNITSKLETFQNREDGSRYLTEKFSTRASLEEFARYLDIPIQRQDNIENLRNKIVDATTGAILRSRAIQGNHNG
jgi:hypothetical protein